MRTICMQGVELLRWRRRNCCAGGEGIVAMAAKACIVVDRALDLVDKFGNKAVTILGWSCAGGF